MTAVRIAPRPVPVLIGASLHLWRWDLVETDTRRVACSVVYDARLDSEQSVWRRVVALETYINEGGST